MFSALNQGSLIHILDKTDGLKYKVGEVIGVTQTNNFNAPIGTSSFPNLNNQIKIKVKVDGNVVDYPEVLSTASIASYNNGNVIISETKEAILSQIETIVQASKNYLSEEFVNQQKTNINEGEAILKKLSPQFAKDKERDVRIDSLDTKVTSMESKLDKILIALSNNTSNPTIKIQ